MKRRWRLSLLLLLLLLSAVGALLHPSIHWGLLGWWRGEAFYRGMPTSYWVNEIEESYHGIWGVGSVKIVGEPIWYVETQPSPWDRLRQQWLSGPAPVSQVISNSPLLADDSAALPVLLQLLRSEVVKVRRVAVSGLAAQARDRPGVVEALQDAANDPDELVQDQARQALRQQRPGQ